MHIYVDADACPVVRQTEELAQKYGVAVTLLCDTNHVLRSDYSEVKDLQYRGKLEQLLVRLLEGEHGN